MAEGRGHKSGSNVSGTSYVGYVDQSSDTVFAGWLVDMDDDDQRPIVQLEIDGLIADTAPCNLHRDGLLTAGFASAAHGFEFRRPSPVPARAEVVIRIAGTEHRLAWLAPRPQPTQGPVPAFLSAEAENGPAYRREALLTLALNGPEVARALTASYPALLGARSLDEALHGLMMQVAARRKTLAST